MKKGELLTTQDINQKFLMGDLNGNEIWALEEFKRELKELK